MLCSFNNEKKIEAIQQLLDRGIEIDYWLGAKRVFEACSKNTDLFPDTIFHNTAHALRAIPAPGINTGTFEVPSASLLNEFSSLESEILTMMNSVDFNRAPLAKKKHLYYKHLSYWYGIFTTRKPDALVFSDPPHIVHNFILFRLAQKLGIRTVMSTEVKRLPDRLLFFNDLESYAELETVYNDLQQKGFELSELSEDLQVYYKKENDPSIDSTPVVTKKTFLADRKKTTRVIPGLSIIMRNIKRLSLFKTAYHYVRQLRRKKTLASLEGFSHSYFRMKRIFGAWNKINKTYQKEYESLQVIPDFEKKFVYVPLHSQPERSTSPEGGVFADQILMIRMLSQALPEGWVIYVKEHPMQWIMYRGFLGRYKGYYQEIADIEHVQLVPADTSTFKLTENAAVVASPTGTASWEALVRARPTLVFGYIWFMHCHGAFRVSSVEDCREALQKIAEGFTVDPKKIVQFLGALDRVCIEAHDHHNYNKTKEIETDINIQRMSDEYYRLLTKPAAV